jgi:hypothetical protein
MNILQIRDEITKIRNYYESDFDENGLKKIKQRLSDLIEEFKIKLEETNESALLSDIIEEDKKNYDMPINLMFLVYQRSLKLEPQKNTLMDFANYLGFVGGPDWEDELEAIIGFTKEDKINEAVEVALKVDYNKYPFIGGID